MTNPKSNCGSSPRPAAGRPRSERARTAILDTSLELLQQVGFRNASVEEIARRAGVSKATIYRWWPNKSAVIMDAFLTATSPQMPFRDTGRTRDDLIRQICSVIRLFNTAAVAGPFVGLLTEAPHDPELAQALRERFIAVRRAAARELFIKGIQRGELRDDLDVDVAIDALYGALYYRLLVSGEPLTPRYGRTLVEQSYPALVATP